MDFSRAEETLVTWVSRQLQSEPCVLNLPLVDQWSILYKALLIITSETAYDFFFPPLSTQ